MPSGEKANVAPSHFLPSARQILPKFNIVKIFHPVRKICQHFTGINNKRS
jgi:hypothetical protein